MRLRIKKERVFFTLTLLRFVLAFVVAILILFHRNKIIATIFFTVTALIAFFESIMRRKLLEASLLRSVLDFLADRALTNFVAIALVIKSLLPLWVMLVFLVRDLLTVLIGFILFYRDSTSGRVVCKPNPKTISLSSQLHQGQ